MTNYNWWNIKVVYKSDLKITKRNLKTLTANSTTRNTYFD